MPPYWKCSVCEQQWTFLELEKIIIGLRGSNEIYTFRYKKALETDQEKVECNGNDMCLVDQWYIFTCPNCGNVEDSLR